MVRFIDRIDFTGIGCGYNDLCDKSCTLMGWIGDSVHYVCRVTGYGGLFLLGIRMLKMHEQLESSRGYNY